MPLSPIVDAAGDHCAKPPQLGRLYRSTSPVLALEACSHRPRLTSPSGRLVSVDLSVSVAYPIHLDGPHLLALDRLTRCRLLAGGGAITDNITLCMPQFLPCRTRWIRSPGLIFVDRPGLEVDPALWRCQCATPRAI